MRINGAIAYHGAKPKRESTTEVIVTDWNNEIAFEFKPPDGRITTLIFQPDQWAQIIEYLNRRNCP